MQQISKIKNNITVKLFLLIFTSTFLTGCIDILSYTAIDKNGDLISRVKISTSKALWEMTYAFEEDVDIDYADMFDIEQLKSMNYIDSCKIIDTDIEYGVYLDINIPKKALNSIDINNEIAAFVPIKRGHSYYMSFNEGNNLNDANVIPSSLKYQVFISKSYISEIVRAVIKNSQGNGYYLDVYDLHDGYLIEIPITFLINGQLIIN